jgi:spartin
MEEYPAEKVGVPPIATAPIASGSNSASNVSAPSTGAWEDGDLRGKLVLVDEADGKVVGTLGEQYDIKEDDALHAIGKEKDPVIIDIPEDDHGRQEVVAHPIDYYEKDFIMKSASLIR